jgi:hypothetical protein
MANFGIGRRDDLTPGLLFMYSILLAIWIPFWGFFVESFHEKFIHKSKIVDEYAIMVSNLPKSETS